MAQAIRTKDLRDYRQGEMTVGVTRPLIEDVPSRWNLFQTYGRAHFASTRRASAPTRVEYRVTIDNGMLQDLLRRAASNKSGKAQRGLAHAENGRVTADLTDKQLAYFVGRAAHAASKRMVDGPFTVKVKLREQPAPVDALCSHCGRPLSAHEKTTAYTRSVSTGEPVNPWTAWWCVPGPDNCPVCAAICQSEDERTPHAYGCSAAPASGRRSSV